jgi:sugar phosphate isomerase/epimerase
MPIGYLGVGGGFGQGWRGDDDGHVAYVKKWIDIAHAMHVPMLRLIGCALEPGESEEDAWPVLAGHFRELTAFARERDVAIGLHNHNHGMFPATSDQIVRMLDEIDDPHFVHILDTGQYRGSRGASKYDEDPNRDDYDLYANIAGSIDRAILVRAKIYAVGSGIEEWIDYPRVMSILKKSGFSGWLSVVFEGRDGTPPMEAMKLARTYLRRLLREYEIG